MAAWRPHTNHWFWRKSTSKSALKRIKMGANSYKVRSALHPLRTLFHSDVEASLVS